MVGALGSGRSRGVLATIKLLPDVWRQLGAGRFCGRSHSPPVARRHGQARYHTGIAGEIVSVLVHADGNGEGLKDLQVAAGAEALQLLTMRNQSGIALELLS